MIPRVRNSKSILHLLTFLAGLRDCNIFASWRWFHLNTLPCDPASLVGAKFSLIQVQPQEEYSILLVKAWSQKKCSNFTHIHRVKQLTLMVFCQLNCQSAEVDLTHFFRPYEYHTTCNPLYTNNHRHGVQNQLLEQIYLDYHIWV